MLLLRTSVETAVNRCAGARIEGGLTLPTPPVQLQAVTLDAKAVLVGDGFLQRLDLRVLKLNDGAAVGTDQVVVMLFAGTRLVAGLTVAEVTRFGDAALGKEFEGAMDRGVADPRVKRAQAQVEFLGGEVGPGPQKLIKDDFALAGGLQPLGGEVGAEIVFGFVVIGVPLGVKLNFNLNERPGHVKT